MEKATIKATAFVGHNYGAREWSNETVYRVISNALVAQGIDGATFAPCVGMWRGELEHTTNVICYGVNRDAFKSAMQATAEELAQFEILCEFDGLPESVENDPSARREELNGYAVA